MSIRANLTRLAALAVLFIALGACASNEARISQFDQFAEAGIAYSESVDSVLHASLATVIETDNRSLIFFRNLNRNEERRLAELERLDDTTKKRAEILGAIRAQLTFLKDYFNALGLLASREEGGTIASTSSGLSESSIKLVDRLSGISTKIKELTIGGQPVRDLVGEAIPVVVLAYQRAALDRTLEATAKPVSEAIGIHQAVLAAIRDQMEADLDFAIEQERTETIALPYARDGALPSNWGEMRANSLMRQVQILELDKAAVASNKLQLAFQALVEKRADGPSFENLLRDLNQLVDLTERLTV